MSIKAIYKYVHKGKIIYIGQTRSSLESRICGHRNEDRFEPYQDAEIYFFEVENNTELDILERLLINKYHPVLNVNNNSPESIEIELASEPDWIKYKHQELRAYSPGRPKGEECVTRSLRIKSDINDLLVKMHEETRMSYNAIVNKALSEYLQ